MLKTKATTKHYAINSVHSSQDRTEEFSSKNHLLLNSNWAYATILRFKGIFYKSVFFLSSRNQFNELKCTVIMQNCKTTPNKWLRTLTCKRSSFKEVLAK